jgi:para-aminobenzoate synthetase/4-amino-4-deoxychorismate lyase
VVEPGGDARFSVAIRTVTVDRERRVARYGTGGGIVWDSDADGEYEECRTKALILTTAHPRFDLLETILWRPRRGFYLLDRHLERLRTSAAFLARPFDSTRVVTALEEAARGFGAERWRVRLTVDPNGRPQVDAELFPRADRQTWTVDLDDRPVASDDPLLFHKTSHRVRYEQAMRRRPDVDEVLLFNERGELTESCRANLVVRVGKRFLTPPRESGLLAGTFRAELLARGRLEERILHASDLATADSVLLVNALRGFIRVQLTGRAALEAVKTRRSA